MEGKEHLRAEFRHNPVRMPQCLQGVAPAARKCDAQRILVVDADFNAANVKPIVVCNTLVQP